MGSHILDILCQGIWASLTGGWFYDSEQQVLSNTFHLYLWLFLLALPLTLYSTQEPSILVWSIYCFVVGLLFTVLKVINYRLHHLFDTGQAQEESPTAAGNFGSGDAAGKGGQENEYIEMSCMGPTASSPDQPVPASNQPHLGAGPVASPLVNKSGNMEKAPLAQIEGYDMPVVHLEPLCSGSSVNDDEDSPDPEDDTPRIITTQAEIEPTPVSSSLAQDLDTQQELADAQVTNVPAVVSGLQVSEADIPVVVSGLHVSDGSHIVRLTLADTQHIPDKCESLELKQAESAKPQNKEVTSGSQPEGSQACVGRESHTGANHLTGVSTSDVEQTGCQLPIKKERKAVRRSKSSMEWSPCSSTAPAKLSSRSLNMSGRASSPPALQHPSTSSNSDWSDVSFGEIELPDVAAIPGGQDDLFLPASQRPHQLASSTGHSSGSAPVTSTQHDRPDSPHPNCIHSIPYRPGSRTSSSSSPLRQDSVKVAPFFSSMWQNQDQGDTDSLTSGDSSSSVMAGQDPGSLRCPKQHDLTSPSSLRSPQDLTSPSSPSLEDVALMRTQGAIPKKMGSRSTHQSSSFKESTSPGSTDLSDPEELRRRLIEILWDPQQHTEELKQLQQFVKMKKSQSATSESAANKEKLTVSNARLTLTRPAGEMDRPPESGGGREDDRKTLTPTELCALLPVNSQLNRATNRRARRRNGRRHPQQKRSTSPPIAALSLVVGEEGHLATSHDDTSDGAVHWFQDEQGNWMSYTFGENSSGVALNLTDINMNSNTNMGLERRRHREPDKSLSSIASNSTVIVEESPALESPDMLLRPDAEVGLQLPAEALQSYVQSLLRRNHTSASSTDSDMTQANTRSSRGGRHKPKHFYKFWVWPFRKFIKIHFDRLSLLAALDRNISVIENVISVLMAVGVAALGALMICCHFYQDLCLLLFCFIMAGCQYSLLKSVQPDAASPMHGYNHIIVFSRPFYFCLCCSVALILYFGGQSIQGQPLYLYGIPLTWSAALTFLRQFFSMFILSFPLLFTLGLLPQVNTFLMYLLEQIDMHVFGGNASTSLLTSFYCVCRSCFALLVLYGFAFASLKEIGGPAHKCDDSKIDDAAQNVPFSILAGLIVIVAYHLSRSASDPGMLWSLIKGLVISQSDKEQQQESPTGELVDPLPDKLKICLKQRLQSDAIVCVVVAVLVFAVHVSTAFTSPALQPVLSQVLYLLSASLGFLVHYIIPQARKEMPWLCCSHPLLRSKEWMYFEVKDAPKVIWVEKLYLGLRFFERNIVCPVVCLCATTTSAPFIICKFGTSAGPLIVLVCSLKMLRMAFSDTARQYLVIAFTFFFFTYDFRWSSETFLIDYFFLSILFSKFCDLMLKLNFILTYIAPWQITWGSAFHAFAQPFSVPHSAMLFLQALVSAILSTPLNPFLGSAIFVTSYVRPIKFWERDYNTKRVDHTNTRLASQLDRNPGADDNNLNSIFYEHLTRSLQHSLCGDLLLGRWGSYTQGDCFIMASDYLNALVHIIEVGNGLVTFQLRGLEFRGTYCQQREVEAITEGVDENQRFCCCDLGHLPHLLSLNAAFSQRWLAWEVVVSKYVLEGYSITDNSAATMLQVFELRKALVTYYIKSIIYYMVRSPRLEDWTENATIHQSLELLEADSYVDLDPTFNSHIDEDFDPRLQGISRSSFCHVFLPWIQHCAHRRDKAVSSSRSSQLVTLCYALSLLGRRALSAASHNSASVDFFLFGLHALFKGDFRIQSQRDEWVFADMDMMRRVVAPAVRMSLKLHQDHFTSPDEYDDCQLLYDAITSHESSMVISHEADPAWRNAVLSNVPSLLALRHVFDEGSDEYKIIMLNKRYLSFRVVKVNRECVRGLWAGQQQELIFLRNRNPERGSIQNAKQALRNMINSSCDQPIGYPIYVSPLTTSYSTTHDQLANMPVIGGEFRFSALRGFVTSVWNRLRLRCHATCAGGSASFEMDLPYTVSHQMAAATIGSTPRLAPTQMDIPLQQFTTNNRGSLISTASSASKVNNLVPLANLTSLISESSKDSFQHRVTVTDQSQETHSCKKLEVH